MRKKEELDLLYDRLMKYHVVYKRKMNQESGDEYYDGTCQLSVINKANLDQEEAEYIFQKLKEKDITVIGDSQIVYGGFENYRYVKKPVNSNKIGKFNKEEFDKALYEYKTMKIETEEDEKRAEELRKEVIMKNANLAKYVAYKFNRKYEFDNDELMSYALEGLILAVDKYDYEKGIFYSYALKCIEGNICRGIHFLRGFNSVNFSIKYKNAKKEIEENLNIEIDDDLEYIDEIATRIYDTYGVKIDSVEDIKTKILLMNTLSTEEVADEIFEDNNLYQKTIEPLNKESLKKDLSKALSILTENEKRIIVERYGIDDEKPKTCREVAKNIGCKFQYVSSTEKRALKKLRSYYSNSKIKSYYDSMGEYDYSPTGIEQVKVKQKVK